MARKEYFTKTISLPNGVRKYITAKTKEELEEKYLTARLQLRAGVDLSDKTTVGQLAQLWFDVEKKPKVKASTAAFWADILDRNVLPSLSNTPVREVLPVQISVLMNALSHRSQSENRHTLQALRGMFALAVDNNLIVKSPVPLTLRPYGKPCQEKQALTIQQEDTLLNAVAGTRAHLFVLLALKTGMRRGELLALKWDCVDLEDACVHVRRNLVFVKGRPILEDSPKTAAGIRSIPITKDLVTILRKVKSSTKSLFVIPCTNGEMMTQPSFRSLWNIVAARQITTESGKSAEGPSIGERRHPGVKRQIDFAVTPHLLRHTYATRLFQCGLTMTEVQHLLGHESPDVTMRIYIHYCQSQEQEKTFRRARKAMSDT